MLYVLSALSTTRWLVSVRLSTVNLKIHKPRKNRGFLLGAPDEIDRNGKSKGKHEPHTSHNKAVHKSQRDLSLLYVYASLDPLWFATLTWIALARIQTGPEPKVRGFCYY